MTTFTDEITPDAPDAPDAPGMQVGGSNSSPPAPLALYKPTFALWSSGANTLALNVDDALTTLWGALYDTPIGASALDITGATLTFSARSVGAGAPVLTGAGFVIQASPAFAGYTFSGAVSSLLAAGTYRCCFSVTWPSGQIIEFGNLNLIVKSVDD